MKGVKLNDVRNDKEITLPKSGGSIVIYDDIMLGDLRKLQGMEDGMEKDLTVLVYMVKDWNFVDEKENKLEINLDNLCKLSTEDIEYMVEQTGILERFKKKQSQLEKSEPK